MTPIALGLSSLTSWSADKPARPACPTGFTALAEAAPALKSAYVPGLYQSIDKAPLPEGWSATSEQITSHAWGRTYDGKLADAAPGAAKPLQARFIMHQEKPSTFSVDVAFLNDTQPGKDGKPVHFPSWVNEKELTPLVAGHGDPSGLFFTLRSMHKLGIAEGSLTRLRALKVRQYDSVCQLGAWLKSKGFPSATWRPTPEELSEQFRKTSMYRYLETVAVQSGHRVKAVRVITGSWPVGAKTPSFGLDPIHGEFSHSGDGHILQMLWNDHDWNDAYYESTLAKYGLKDNDDLIYDFNVEMDLERR